MTRIRSHVFLGCLTLFIVVAPALASLFGDLGLLWRLERVDVSPGTGKAPAVETDRQGGVHITYVDPGSDSLRYAHLEADEWITDTIDSLSAIGPESALAVDGEGRPHVLWARGTPSFGLMYAYLPPSGWQVQTVSPSSFPSEPAIAVDSLGHPHIAYFTDVESGVNAWSLMYRHWDGSQWSLQRIAGPSAAGMALSLALDGDDNPRIAYCAYSGTTLNYAWHDGSWHTEEITGTVRGDLSLALDELGNPHVAFHNELGDGDQLEHYWQDEGGWHSEPIASDVTGMVSLQMAPGGIGHVAYVAEDDGESTVQYAFQADGQWHTEVVGPGVSVSMALDSDHMPSVALHDAQGLWYSMRVISPPYSCERRILYNAYETGQYQVYSMAENGADVVQLTFGLSGAKQPSWSADCRKILYVSGEEIWAINSDGTDPHRIEDLTASSVPVFAPDGSQIAFAADHDGQGIAIYLAGLVGDGLADVQRLSTYGAYQDLDWAPDGAMIAYTERISENERRLCFVDLEGNQACLSGLPAVIRSPKFSPDGTEIVYEAEGELRVVGADGSGDRPLLDDTTDTGHVKGYLPSWMSDERILYTYPQPWGNADAEIYAIDVDGIDKARVTTNA